MKALHDPDHALASGLAAIRTEFAVPAAFPPAVLAAAEAARAEGERVDRTAIRFVTLDPAASTDLDQAFALEAIGSQAGGDLLLRYAIADVGAFVPVGGAIEREAWARGETLYLPDGKAPLYPPVLSQGAASLLPDGPRPAVVFAVRIAEDGAATLDGAERATIRSAAKLAYETVTDADLPPLFPELARRVAAAEAARGATRVDPPEQEVAPTDDGGFSLAFRPRRSAEDANAALSLACNLAVAAALQAHGTGLFRVMPAPEDKAVARLRHAAAGLGVAWAAAEPLDAVQRRLDATDPRQAALMLAIRRASGGASYQPFRAGVVPWHAAMAAPYAHATAPLRRLADRYVVEAALAVANGQMVPDPGVFERLPPVMARGDALAARIDRAVIDLAETVALAGRVGATFAATVVDADAKGGRVQLADEAVVARVTASGLVPGAAVRVRLMAADVGTRSLRFDLS